ncbi:MAG: response regulator [Alphaproteobacteria bacterium]
MNENISILIAEDNEISRELMATILKTQGYTIIPVADGEAAIRAVQKQAIDLALVDLNMEPKGGFEFVKYLVVSGVSLPVVIITSDDSSDVLMRANDLGVTRVLQKPVEPDRLLGTVQRILKRYGHNLNYIASETHKNQYTPDQLMQRAIELAERNAQSRKGGPFGAVVASLDGEILGEGANGITSRVDPTAHAEIMAIRQAAEKLGRSNLEDCVLYCSSEPTMMGQALVISVGIPQVYYGLSHNDIKHIREKDSEVRDNFSGKQKSDTQYTQISHVHAMTMFERWQSMDEKLND